MESNIQSGDNCFDNAETLLQSYNGILVCLVKIEEKLSSLRKTSENKISNMMQKRIVKLETKFELEDSYNSEDASDSSKDSYDILNNSYDRKNTNGRTSDLSIRFAERLNDLYAHMVSRHIEEEKLLDKYFDTARSIREKNAINLTRNKLNTLKMRKTLYDDNASLKKRQRALLMRLQSEYNEIRFMSNFQKKLSEDRRRNLFRQLKHFKTVLCTERSVTLGTCEQQKNDYRLEIVPDAEDMQNRKKELNEILDLHSDLRKNVIALKTITHKRPHTQVVLNLKRLSEDRIPACRKRHDTIANRPKTNSINTADMRIVQMQSTGPGDVFDLFVPLNMHRKESQNGRNGLAKTIGAILFHYFRAYCGRNAIVSVAKVKFRNVIEKIYLSQNQPSESNHLSLEERMLCLFGTLLSLVETLVGRKIITFGSLKKFLLNNFEKVFIRMDLLDCDKIVEALTLNIARVKAQRECTFIDERRKIKSIPPKKSNRNMQLSVRNDQEKHLREKFVSTTSMVYEELKKKQLAVEMEIKALLEQNSPMQYFLVREIPDKPPPPYIPPSEDTVKFVEGTLKKDAKDISGGNQIERTVKVCFEHVWIPFLSGCYSTVDKADMHLIESQSSTKSSKSHLIENMFLYDLCNELFATEYRDLNKKNNPWDYCKYYSPSMRNNICRRIQSLAEQHLEHAVVCKEDIYGSYAQKAQYHVDELLTRELHTEEAEWVDMEEHVSTVKNMLTETILNGLIDDTVREYKYLY